MLSYDEYEMADIRVLETAYVTKRDKSQQNHSLGLEGTYQASFMKPNLNIKSLLIKGS